MNLNNKKIFIAPHTPKSTMFAHHLKQTYKTLQFLGFIDKTKTSSDIYKIEKISNIEFDFILIYSPNHFNSIYKDYTKFISKKKLIKIVIKNNRYIFLSQRKILLSKIKNIPSFVNFALYKLFNAFLKIKKDEIIFISKEFISSNNKAFLLYCLQQYKKVSILTDNKKQLSQLKKYNICSFYLGSIKSLYKLSKAKFIILDQGNANEFLRHLHVSQKTVQLWHGVPLKRMNKIVDVIYDFHVSTSDYVNATSLDIVVQAKKHFDFGYPRNDLLLKEHSQKDFLFVDKKLYDFTKNNKTILYMPTHRESSPSIKKTTKFPLDLDKLNSFLKPYDLFFIIKLHPFASILHKKQKYSNIIFSSSQNDIYPILKYTNLLITDYSSVYFDFLLLNKPIIFFNYDFEQYVSNINGFVYNYEENTPGIKVGTQDLLEKSIKNILINKQDKIKQKREDILDKFFTYKDGFTCKRVYENIIKDNL